MARGRWRGEAVVARPIADSACSREQALDHVPAATSAIEPAVGDASSRDYRTR
jgi:hypothetical protein